MRRARILLWTIVCGMLLSLAAGTFFIAGSPPKAHAANVELPADMDWFNVRDYGATGNGTTDDTQAIRDAINDARVNSGGGHARIYFPDGTYLISDTLTWRKENGDFWSFLSFQGQSRGGTIIRLADNAAGYQDTNQPKAVLFTASSLDGTSGPYEGGKDYPALGEGNTAFTNDIQDLTVETGSGNPGAIGIDYLASNLGVVRNVTIRSGDGQGQIGLAVVRKWDGPDLISNVRIIGFNYAIKVNGESYHTTFEHITIEGQHVAGVFNEHHPISIRDLQSTNQVPVIQNKIDGHVVLTDGTFNGTGTASSISAIENESTIWVRNIQAPGYASALKNHGTVMPGTSIEEFVSHPVHSLFPSPQTSLNLPVQETPPIPEIPASDWANVESYGATGNDGTDDTAAIQAAIDSGKSVVYLPHAADYTIGTVIVRNNVQRIVGLYGGLGGGTLRIEDGSSPVVSVEQFFGSVRVVHASTRTLVVRDTAITSYRNVAGSGPLFIENVVGGDWLFDHQNVWARQFDIEGDVNPKVENRGGNLWVLGIKSEGVSTLIETNSGGSTEVLGGVLYPVGQVPATMPAFRSVDAKQSLIYAVNHWDWAGRYTIHVEEVRNGETRQLLDTNVTNRRLPGGVISLFTGTGDIVEPPDPTPGSGGLLDGSSGSSPSTVDLTSEGSDDWVHWGLDLPGSLTYKANVPRQISTFSRIGNGTIFRQPNVSSGYATASGMSWTDGYPTASVVDNRAGLQVNGIGNGFQITVPADTTQRTLKLYVGAWNLDPEMKATLSDGSAAEYINTAFNDPAGNGMHGVYTINYRAASAGQTLTIRWTIRNTYFSGGTISLQAATLSGGGPIVSGSMGRSQSEINLTTEGQRDWAHWGMYSNSSIDHKNNVTQQISNFTRIGWRDIGDYAGTFSGYTWTDGTPNASIHNTHTGLYIGGADQGFQITAPADTTSRALRIYVSTRNGQQGRFEARLSDSSSVYVDTTLHAISGEDSGVYIIRYRAGSAGQTLTIKFTGITHNGDITLQAATLQ